MCVWLLCCGALVQPAHGCLERSLRVLRALPARGQVCRELLVQHLRVLHLAPHAAEKFLRRVLSKVLQIGLGMSLQRDSESIMSNTA